MELLNSLVNKTRSVLGMSEKEWAADEPAGDELAYDGMAVLTCPYDHSQFVRVTNGD